MSGHHVVFDMDTDDVDGGGGGEQAPLPERLAAYRPPEQSAVRGDTPGHTIHLLCPAPGDDDDKKKKGEEVARDMKDIEAMGEIDEMRCWGENGLEYPQRLMELVRQQTARDSAIWLRLPMPVYMTLLGRVKHPSKNPLGAQHGRLTKIVRTMSEDDIVTRMSRAIEGADSPVCMIDALRGLFEGPQPATRPKPKIKAKAQSQSQHQHQTALMQLLAPPEAPYSVPELVHMCLSVVVQPTVPLTAAHIGTLALAHKWEIYSDRRHKACGLELSGNVSNRQVIRIYPCGRIECMRTVNGPVAYESLKNVLSVLFEHKFINAHGEIEYNRGIYRSRTGFPINLPALARFLIKYQNVDPNSFRYSSADRISWMPSPEFTVQIFSTGAINYFPKRNVALAPGSSGGMLLLDSQTLPSVHDPVHHMPFSAAHRDSAHFVPQLAVASSAARWAKGVQAIRPPEPLQAATPRLPSAGGAELQQPDFDPRGKGLQPAGDLGLTPSFSSWQGANWAAGPNARQNTVGPEPRRGLDRRRLRLRILPKGHASLLPDARAQSERSLLAASVPPVGSLPSPLPDASCPSGFRVRIRVRSEACPEETEVCPLGAARQETEVCPEDPDRVSTEACPEETGRQPVGLRHDGPQSAASAACGTVGLCPDGSNGLSSGHEALRYGYAYHGQKVNDMVTTDTDGALDMVKRAQIKITSQGNKVMTDCIHLHCYLTSVAFATMSHLARVCAVGPCPQEKAEPNGTDAAELHDDYVFETPVVVPERRPY